MARVRVFVTLKPSLLDSAGRTVADSLVKLGYSEVKDVRIGRVIEMDVEPLSEERIVAMAKQLLANPVIESYRYEVLPESATV